jgi:hypothetical protein
MVNFESSSLSWVRSARAEERRNSRRDEGAFCRYAFLTIGVDLGDRRLETGGATDGTAGTAMLGAGGGGILAALPMPLGSLTELLRPPALPGPRGIPLTPASCAKNGVGAARQPANAKAKNDDLPNTDHTSQLSNEGPGLPFLVQITSRRLRRRSRISIRVASMAQRKRPQRRGLCWGRFEGVSGFHSTNTVV